MVLPLLPIAIGGLAAGGGFGLGSWFGGGKKEVHAPYEYYAPTTSSVYAPTDARQLQFAPVSSYAYQGATYIIDSPGATSKKQQSMETVSRPEQSGEWDFPIGVEQRPSHAFSEGIDTTTIAILGAVAVVAYAVISRGKGKKK